MSNSYRRVVRSIAILAVSGALTRASRGQDSSQDAGRPLGDVVRHQQDEKERKKAKHVLGDEEVSGPHRHQVTGTAATTVIIPYITITGMVPDSVVMNTPPNLKQKMVISFGPSLDACFDLKCAESTYLRSYPATFGGMPKVLFDSDEWVQGNPARVAHLEIMHDERGKMFATVAFIQTPASAATASCIYRSADAPEVETECEAFIASLEVHIPEKYIYVQHRYY